MRRGDRLVRGATAARRVEDKRMVFESPWAMSGFSASRTSPAVRPRITGDPVSATATRVPCADGDITEVNGGVLRDNSSDATDTAGTRNRNAITIVMATNRARMSVLHGMRGAYYWQRVGGSSEWPRCGTIITASPSDSTPEGPYRMTRRRALTGYRPIGTWWYDYIEELTMRVNAPCISACKGRGAAAHRRRCVHALRGGRHRAQAPYALRGTL